MATEESVLQTLKRFDIDEQNLLQWEKALGLSIACDSDGQKQYSAYHVNLFKNVKKHLALGRSLSEICSILAIPQASQAHEVKSTSAFASSPTRPAGSATGSESLELLLEKTRMQPVEQVVHTQPVKKMPVAIPDNNSKAFDLVERLLSEKDSMQQRLIETERLNSHLFNANQAFHKKVHQLTEHLQAIREKLQATDTNKLQADFFKLMEEKAGLQREYLNLERQFSQQALQLSEQEKQASQHQADMAHLQTMLADVTTNFDASRFCGDWVETSQLKEVVYDNFGMNIEANRQRLFRIGETPKRVYGSTALIATLYAYESNTLWNRSETMVLSWLNDEHLTGELFVEYWLDGVPVAKAIYTLQCAKQPA